VLTFNEGEHKYFWDGGKVPGVSEIVAQAGLVDWGSVPPIVLDRACKFGTAVHKATEYADKGTLKRRTLDKALTPFVDAWELFKKDTGAKIEKIEWRVYSARYRFAGTIDRIARINGKLCLIDIKTGKQIGNDKHLQIGGYDILARENKAEVDARMFVQLSDKGYKVTKSESPEDIACFKALANLWHYKKSRGYIK
jgi:hypothetical protein